MVWLRKPGCVLLLSQASFDPPGLTVSVKKDRAMEPLMQVCVRVGASDAQLIVHHCATHTIENKEHPLTCLLLSKPCVPASNCG
jgi:hypothetical protein